ncbi:MAG TPA: alpha/beta hydrolase [Rhabdaerophilum sp.]|nr:alpha/beta hydrolase [Rhabdaerophilum sp.]
MNAAAQFLDVRADAARGLPARRLAYVAKAGRRPTIIWMGGFRSDMTSTKAMKLEEAAAAEGRASLRFDYSAHGDSSGNFSTATLSQWLDDALHMIRERGGKKPVIVGSSMGGWLALRATQVLAADGNPPGGLVLIAPAVDFTEALMWAQFPETIRRQIMDEGVWYRPSEYSPEPYPITRALIEDGRKHLLLGKALRFGVPIHVLQGGQDPDVPLAHVEGFVAELAQDDVRMTVIPDGNHRLSRDEDIETLQCITMALAGEIEKAD